MDINLIGLLSKGSILVNLYTGDRYVYLEKSEQPGYVKAVLQAHEKWNKYKLIYEDEPEKEVNVDVIDLVPTDKIPFMNARGKKLFDVRNMDIVTYKRNKEIIKARVVFLGNAENEKDIVFTFVGQNGDDISDTGNGYTVEQFAQEFNKKGKAIKRVQIEGGVFAEVDRRFNTTTQEKDVIKEKALKKVKLIPTDEPLSVADLNKRLAKLKCGYKDGFAFEKTGLFKHGKPRFITEKYLDTVIADAAVGEIERFRYLEVYNIAKQLQVHEQKNKYQVELANIKRKATIDVTEEEKANSNSNIERIDANIAACDKELAKLDGYRRTIVNDYNDAVALKKNNKKKSSIKQKEIKAADNTGEDVA